MVHGEAVEVGVKLEAVLGLVAERLRGLGALEDRRPLRRDEDDLLARFRHTRNLLPARISAHDDVNRVTVLVPCCHNYTVVSCYGHTN